MASSRLWSISKPLFQKYPSGDYMGDVARVHLQLRKAKVKAVDAAVLAAAYKPVSPSELT